MSTPEPTRAAIVVRLIDPNQGRPLQEWRFDSPSEISIGRAEERNITIPDPQVSRLHVVLTQRDGEWWIVSHGQNGVLVDGRKIDEAPTGGGCTFRLGANGPLLSFLDTSDKPVHSSASATIQDLDDAFADLQLDQGRLEQDVRDITDGDFFQKLASQANEFRQRKQPGTNDGQEGNEFS
jgi:hypothetical protein